jgi:hypothetical protein
MGTVAGWVRPPRSSFGKKMGVRPKAWSQNLDHEKVLTTFMSYGSVAGERQADILNELCARLSMALIPVNSTKRPSDLFSDFYTRRPPSQELSAGASGSRL